MKTYSALHKLFVIFASLALSAVLGCGGEVFKNLLSGGGDKTQPTVVSVYQYDCDKNGKIDEVVLEFSHSMDDSTITDTDAARFTIEETGFVGTGSPTCTGSVDPDSSNDKYVTLFTNNRTVPGTDAKKITYTEESNRVLNSNGNSLASFTIEDDDPMIHDMAAPIITGAVVDIDDTRLNILFSEPVSPDGNGWTTCSGTLTETIPGTVDEIDYYPNGSTNVASLVYDSGNGDDINACDSKIKLTANTSVFNTNDIFISYVKVSSTDPLYDGAQNEAITDSVTIKGVIKPYVKTVTSVTSTKARVTFSEPMYTGAGTENYDALTLSNYTYGFTSGSSCNATISAITHVSGNTVFDLTTGEQNTGCTYIVTINSNMKDLNEGAPMTDPKFGTFKGSEALRVVSMEAKSLYSFEITFSKDVLDGTGAGGCGNTSYYTIPTNLGSVSNAQRSSTELNKVTVTHSKAQGVGIYTAVVSTNLRAADVVEYLSPNPRDRATFVGFGGSIENLEDGAIFNDPFVDGTSFAFSFEYDNKIYLGPNETNEGVFRFDPDGSNATLVTFSIKSADTTNSSVYPYTSFGYNIKRPVTSIYDNAGKRRYYITPGTDISKYNVGVAKLLVSNCTNSNNISASVTSIADNSGNRRYYVTPGTDLSQLMAGVSKITVSSCIEANNNIGSTTITSVDDTNDYVDVNVTYYDSNATSCAATLFTNNDIAIAETITSINDTNDYIEVNSTYYDSNSTNCSASIFSNNGPAPNTMDGVDYFTKATIDGNTYLLFGAHNEGGGGFYEMYFTQDKDDVLDIDYCTMTSETIGNSTSLQQFLSDGSYLYLGFAADASRLPTFFYMSGLTPNGVCPGLNSSVTTGGSNLAVRITNIGANGGNTANYIGVDSQIIYNDGGNQLFLANNGGISRTNIIPPTSSATWASVINSLSGTENTTKPTGWTGVTREIPSFNKLRPGEKGIPSMVKFNNSLYVARNVQSEASGSTTQTPVRGELWRCTSGCTTMANWNKIFDSSESGNPNNKAISMVNIVEIPSGTQKYLYIGFDNETDGAEVFKSTNGDTFTKVGISGLGPKAQEGTDDIKRNKHIISFASVYYDLKSYLYVNIGCLSDFTDNGVCDRDRTTGATDFSIKVFRQIDQ